MTSIKSLIKTTLGNVIYIYVIHEIASEEANNQNKRLKIANIVITISALVLMFMSIQDGGNQAYLNRSIGLLVIDVLLLLIQLAFFDIEKMFHHKNTANQLRAIRDNLLLLLGKILGGKVTDDQAMLEYEKLLDESWHVNNNSLKTTEKHFKEAQKKLGGGNKDGSSDYTFSEQELDKLLPRRLRS